MSTKHQGTDLGGERRSTTSIMGIIDNVGVVLEEADLDSMDSDGITLDWTTSTTTLMKFYVEAWGGSDVEDVTVLDFAVPDVTGNFSNTSMSFQPNFSFTLFNGNLENDEFLNKLLFAQGCALSASSRWCLSGSNKNKVTKTLQGGGALDADGWLSVRKKPAQYDSECELVTYNSDGFTANVSDAAMDPWDAFGLFFNITTIADVAIGTFNKSTGGAPATEAITSIGNDPSLVSFMTAGGEAVGTVRDNEFHASWGFMFETVECYVGSNMTEDAADDPVRNGTTWSESKVISLRTDANSATIDAEADGTSFDTGGFTITWSTNDSNAWGVGWVAWEGESGLNIVHAVTESVNRIEDTKKAMGLSRLVPETIQRTEGFVSARDLAKIHTETVERVEDIKIPYLIAGLTMANDLSILPNCRVVLLKHDGAAEASRIYTIQQHTNSNGSGAYKFVVLDTDPRYLVVAYDDQAEDARGVTNDDLTPKLA